MYASIGPSNASFATRRTKRCFEGIREGIKEGRKEGRKEREKEIARSLKGKVPVDIIISSTGLTAEEIAAL